MSTSKFKIFMKNILSILLLFIGYLAVAQVADADLDALIQKTCDAFDVPGISVGIYKDGEVVYAKGFGKSSLKTGRDMDDETLVGVASNSKGFTCFALAMMVDEGKLNWDDPVRKYVPEFQLSDPWVTEHFTVRDLVTHRSGMSLGAGDLMFFPDGNDFGVADVIAGVKHIQPETAFRQNFRYNNNMFIIAGEVLKRLSGMEWAEFIEERIMKPVGMTSSKGAYDRVPAGTTNIIDAHMPVDGQVQAIPHDWSNTANAAGGIMSNVQDMLTWAQFLMRGGVTESGERIISKRQMHELWQLQTPLPVGPNHPYDTHFRGYSLGWFVSDLKGGYKEVTHTGGLIGTVTQFTMIPELDLAIIVLTNQMVGSAFNTLTRTIKDSYLGYEDRDWLTTYANGTNAWKARTDSIKTAVYAQVDKVSHSRCVPRADVVSGTYHDNWFGDIEVSQADGGLRIHCVRSPRLSGMLLPYSANTFVAKWDDRSYDADAFFVLSMNADGEPTGATMRAISPSTDFSFDFHDLDLKKVK